MRLFDDPAQVVCVRVGEPFAVELEGNPTTGYTWQADVDSRYLELIGQEFRPAGPGIGAGGHEIHRFQGMEAGKTEIALTYRRPWGGPARDERRFRVVIA